jgi:D-inositol-3-phosphate glycosyltransferase
MHDTHLNADCSVSSSLRIAMLSIHSSPIGPLGTSDTGGMSVYVRELSRWLGAAGHQVDIFTCAGADEPERRLYPNVQLIRLPSAFGKVQAGENRPELLPRVFQELDDYARSHRRDYDIVHSHYWLSGVVGAMAQARWRRPHLTMFHTLGAVKNAARSGEVESQIRIAHEQWLAMTADRVIVAAQRELDHLVGFYHARRTHISVIPCGVNLDLFQPSDRKAARRRLGLVPDDAIVLYVGRFAPVKGVDRLIASVREIRDRFAGLQVLIVGGDGKQAPGSKLLMDLADRSGLKAVIRFMGRVEQSDLPVYYNAADLLALPSRYESFGLVVLESLACGIPVVATPVGMVESIVQEGVNGTVTASADPGDIGNGIARVLAQSHEKGWCATKIRATAENYGWPRVAAAVTDIYEALRQEHDPAQSPPAYAPCIGLPN